MPIELMWNTMTPMWRHCYEIYNEPLAVFSNLILPWIIWVFARDS